MSSTSRTGRLSLNEVRLIDITSKVGSFGFAEISADAAAPDAAPIRAELQLHFTFLPIIFTPNYSPSF